MMIKQLIATSIAITALTGQTKAASQIGQEIYNNAFTRGCGHCHNISFNPQLPALIKSGKLDRAKFGTVLKEGRSGMPKAMDQIMGLGSVKKAGLTEEQAIDAVYEYLSN